MFRSRLLVRALSLQAGGARCEHRPKDDLKKLLRSLEEGLRKRGVSPEASASLHKNMEAVQQVLKTQAEELKKLFAVIKNKFEERTAREREELGKEESKLESSLKEIEEAVKKSGGEELKSVFDSVKKQMESIGLKSKQLYGQHLEKEFTRLWEGIVHKVKETGPDKYPRNMDIYLVQRNIEHCLEEAERSLSLPDSGNRTDIISHQKEKLIRFLGQLESLLVAKYKKDPQLKQAVQRLEEKTVEAIATVNVGRDKIHMLDPEQFVGKMKAGYDGVRKEILEATATALQARQEIVKGEGGVERWLNETEEELKRRMVELKELLRPGNIDEKMKEQLRDGARQILDRHKAAVKQKMESHPELRARLEGLKAELERVSGKLEKGMSQLDLEEMMSAVSKHVGALREKVAARRGSVAEDWQDIQDIFSRRYRK